MYVRSAETDAESRENNCDLRRIYPWRGVVEPPWNSSLVSVRPGESTTRHGHPTDETFIFTAGDGRVTVGEEHRAVTTGDVVYVPGGHEHVVTNESARDPLTFVSIFWLQPTHQEATAPAEAP